MKMLCIITQSGLKDGTSRLTTGGCRKKTLKKIMWCDDDTIKPYFTEAGRNITYGNLKRQLQSPLFLRVCRKNKKISKKVEKSA